VTLYRVYLFANEEIIDDITHVRIKPNIDTNATEMTDYLISFSVNYEIVDSISIGKGEITLTNSFGLFTSTEYAPDSGYDSDPRFASRINIRKNMSVAIREDGETKILYHGKIDDIEFGEDTITLKTYDYWLPFEDSITTAVYTYNSYIRKTDRWTGTDTDADFERLTLFSQFLKDIIYTSTPMDFLYNFEFPLLLFCNPELGEDFYVEIDEDNILNLIRAGAKQLGLVVYMEPQAAVGGELEHEIYFWPLIEDEEEATPYYTPIEIYDVNYVGAPTDYVIEGEPTYEETEDAIVNHVRIKCLPGVITRKNYDSIQEYGTRTKSLKYEDLTEDNAIELANKLLASYSLGPYTGSFNISRRPDASGDVDNADLWGVRPNYIIAIRYPRLGLGSSSTFSKKKINSIQLEYDGRLECSIDIGSSQYTDDELLERMGLKEESETSSQGEDTKNTISKSLSIVGQVKLTTTGVEDFEATSLTTFDETIDFTDATVGRRRAIELELDRRFIPNFYSDKSDIQSGTPFEYDFFTRGYSGGANLTYDDIYERLSIISDGLSESRAIRIENIPHSDTLYWQLLNYDIQRPASLVVDISPSIGVRVRLALINDSNVAGRVSEWVTVPPGSWRQVELLMNEGWDATPGISPNDLTLEIKPLSGENDWSVSLSNGRLSKAGGPFEPAVNSPALTNSRHNLNEHTDRITKHIIVDFKNRELYGQDFHRPKYISDLSISLTPAAPSDFIAKEYDFETNLFDPDFQNVYGAVGMTIISDYINRTKYLGNFIDFWTDPVNPPVLPNPGDTYIAQGVPYWQEGSVVVWNGISWIETQCSPGIYLQNSADTHFYMRWVRPDMEWKDVGAVLSIIEYFFNWFYPDGLTNLGVTSDNYDMKRWREGSGGVLTDQVILEGDSLSVPIPSTGDYSANYFKIESINNLHGLPDTEITNSAAVLRFVSPFTIHERQMEELSIELWGFDDGDVNLTPGTGSSKTHIFSLGDTDVLKRRLFADSANSARPTKSGAYDPFEENIDFGVKFISILDSWFEGAKLSNPPMYALLSTSSPPTPSNSIIAPLVKDIREWVSGDVGAKFTIPLRGWSHLSPAAITTLHFLDDTPLYADVQFSEIYICNAFYYYDPGGSSEAVETMRYNSLFHFALSNTIDFDSSQYGRVVVCEFKVENDNEAYGKDYISEHTKITDDGLKCVSSRIMSDSNIEGADGEFTKPITTMSAGINYDGTYDANDETADTMAKPFVFKPASGERVLSSFLPRFELQRVLDWRGAIEDAEKYDYVREIGLTNSLNSSIETQWLAYDGEWSDILVDGTIDLVDKEHRVFTWELDPLQDYTVDLLRFKIDAAEKLKRYGKDTFRYYPRQSKLFFNESVGTNITEFDAVVYHPTSYTDLAGPYINHTSNWIEELQREGHYEQIAITTTDQYRTSPLFEDCIKISNVRANTANLINPDKVFRGSLNLDIPADVGGFGGSHGFDEEFMSSIESIRLSTLINKGTSVYTPETISQISEIDDDFYEISNHLEHVVVSPNPAYNSNRPPKWLNIFKGKLGDPLRKGLKSLWKPTGGDPYKTDTTYSFDSPYLLVGFLIPEDVDISDSTKFEIVLRGGSVIRSEDNAESHDLATLIMNNRGGRGVARWEKIEGLSGNLPPYLTYKAVIATDSTQNPTNLSDYIASDRMLYILLIVPIASDAERKLAVANIYADVLTLRIGNTFNEMNLREGVDYFYNWYKKGTGEWDPSELSLMDRFIMWPHPVRNVLGSDTYEVRKPEKSTQLETTSVTAAYNTNVIQLSKTAFNFVSDDFLPLVTVGDKKSSKLVTYYEAEIVGGELEESEYVDPTIPPREPPGVDVAASVYQVVPSSGYQSRFAEFSMRSAYDRVANSMSLGIVKDDVKIRSANLLDPKGDLFSTEMLEHIDQYTHAGIRIDLTLVGGVNIIMEDADANETKRDGSGQDALNLANNCWVRTDVPSGLLGLAMRLTHPHLVSGTEWDYVVAVYKSSAWVLRYAKTALAANHLDVDTSDLFLLGSVTSTNFTYKTRPYYAFNEMIGIEDVGGDQYKYYTGASSSAPVTINMHDFIGQITAGYDVNITTLNHIPPVYRTTISMDEGITVMRTVLKPGRMLSIMNIFGRESIFISQEIEFVT